MPSDRTISEAVSGKTAATGHAAQPMVAAIGAVIAGLAAMSCCVAPLIFILAGISGAWIATLTALSPYQPIFVGFALASIAYGHFRRYRAQKACLAGGACAAPLPRRLVDAGLWTGTALVAAALAANFVMPWLLT
jgi:mercuric ion transport protein